MQWSVKHFMFFDNKKHTLSIHLKYSSFSCSQMFRSNAEISKGVYNQTACMNKIIQNYDIDTV